MKFNKLTVPLALVSCVYGIADAQDVAIKTNLLNWATTTPNIGVEFGLGRKSTIQLFGDINPWEFGDDKHFRSWTVQPEYRYWFCEKFGGHFVGVHALAGQYNAKGINFPLKGLIISSSVKSEVEGDPDPASLDKGWPDLTSDLNGVNESGKRRHAEGWFAGFGVTYGYQWMLSKHWNLEASIGVGYVYSDLTLYGRCNTKIDTRKLHYVGPTKAALSIMYVF
jgi:hypothetical protein